MAEQQPPHPGPGLLVVGSRPFTAPPMVPTGRGRTGAGSVRTRSHRDEARPATSQTASQLTQKQVELRICSRLGDIRSALMAADPDGTGLVSQEDFRRVLRSVGQNQLDHVLKEVCPGGGAMVDYLQFLRRFSRAPVTHRACSSVSVRRCGVRSTSMSLSETLKHLRDKIGGNLRTVIRAFRLFDFNRRGLVEQHEFRRVLDRYCLQLTDKEFDRLWSHYSPNNMSIISYRLFLDKLGFGDSHNLNIAPVCTKLELQKPQNPPVIQGSHKRVQDPHLGTTVLHKQQKFKREVSSQARPASQTGSCVAASVLPHRKLQALFHYKIWLNSTPVWQALQAFDPSQSGLVKHDVFRAVLESFIFPMKPCTFQKLTSRYGVKAVGPVRWKNFLGHFMSPVSGGRGERVSEKFAPDEDSLDLHSVHPRLKEIHRVLATKEGGHITRADLQYSLERPGGAHPGLAQPQIKQLLDVLDPEHSGVIQLDKLHPGATSITTGNMPPSSTPISTPDPSNVSRDAERGDEKQQAADERPSTRWADKVSVASASTVEGLPVDKLCEQLNLVLADLKLCDPQHSGYITLKELSRLLRRYGVPISDTHFKKLCSTSCSSRPGSSSTVVSYSDVFRKLGVPQTDPTHSPTSCCSHNNTNHTERSDAPSRSTLQSARWQHPPATPAPGDIRHIVFQRMRSRLEQRRTSLSSRIQAVAPQAGETLSEADVRKILEDSWVVLDEQHFSMLAEQLGFRDGRIQRSAFQDNYQEVVTRGRRRSPDCCPPLTSADECLAAMKTRIKVVHGDNLAAFRLMDKNRKGAVDGRDFRALHDSLKFVCSAVEYQRLLERMGLHAAGTLNYSEFVDVVENDGKPARPQSSVLQRLHELLACDARSKWASMSKVLCQLDADGQAWIHKKSLRGLLFSYALPLTPGQFDQLWSRYDPQARGSVAACDFLERLGFHHRDEPEPRSREPVEGGAAGPLSFDASSLERIERVLQEHPEELSHALSRLGRDGTVTVEELLRLLHCYSCSLHRQQLVELLHRLRVSMDGACGRLHYMDFLSAFSPKPEDRRLRPPPSTPDAVRHPRSLDKLSAATTAARLRRLVSASAPNLHKAFSAIDPGCTGSVGALEFRRVLESFCARLSDRQFKSVLAELELDRDDCTVSWRDFLNKFQLHRPLSARWKLQENHLTDPFL